MNAVLRDKRIILLLTLAAAVLSALLCELLAVPLPWMIGPLFTAAAGGMAGLPLWCPARVREAGQWAIGTALGLYFTPAVLVVLYAYVGYIAAGVAFALLLGAGCGWLLHKLAGIDRTTAFFAMAVGGASEMATQGERHGARVDRVAAAHSLRIMLVVAIIPALFQLWGVHGQDAYTPGAHTVHYGGLVVLVLLTVLGALALRRFDVPNAWVLGPMAVAIALSASAVNLSSLPEWMVHLGQLFIGISLGTRFTPRFLHTAPRFLAAVAICTLGAMSVAAAFAFALASVSGMNAATAVLATSPGGIAEMSLTAKNLQLGVPLVTAFHVSRLVLLVLTIGPLYRLGARFARPAQR